MTKNAFLVPKVLLYWFLATVGSQDLAASQSKSPSGVIIEEVRTESALQRIGVKAGDAILNWERVSSDSSSAFRGSIDSFFDWLWLNIEQVPRGGLKLTVLQNGLPQVLEVPEGHWDAKVRPSMEENFFRSILFARELAKSGQSQQAADALTKLIDEARNQRQMSLSYWLSLQASDVWAASGNWDKAKELQIVALKEVGGPRDQALAWLNMGDLFRDREDLDEALEAYRKATSLAEGFERNSLLVAKAYYDVANILRLEGSVDLAEEYSLKALKIQQDLAPNSMPVALSLKTMATLKRSKGDFVAAKQHGRLALEILERLAPNSTELALGLNMMGSISLFSGDLDAAERELNRALSIQKSCDPGGQNVAIILSQLATLADKRGNARLSQRLQEEALADFRKVNPESTAVATALGNLGVLAWKLEDFDLALQRYQEALLIQNRLAPDGLDTARTLSNLGALLRDRGDFAGAEDCLNRAQSIIGRVAPHSTTNARILHNLGILTYSRGDLELAKDYYQRALTLFQEIDPTGRELTIIMNNMGAVAAASLDLESAEDYYLKAIKSAQAKYPESADVAGALMNIGIVAYERKRFKTAEGYFVRALNIYRKVNQNSLHVTDCLHNLGNVAAARGDLVRAEKYHKQALRMVESIAPNSIDVATGLHSLGIYAHKKGDLAQALIYHRRALGIVERLAPGSTKEASCATAIASILYEQGYVDKSIEYLYRAIESIERQVTRLGEQQSDKLEYRTKYKDSYSNLIELLLKKNRAEEAFAVLERSRARDLLEMLSCRDLTIKEIPIKMSAEKRRLEIEYDRVQQEILGIGHSDRANRRKLATYLSESRRLMREHEEIVSKVRQASARFASLRYPEPLKLADAQRALDYGTVMLAYDVGEKQTALFVVKRQGPVSAMLINIGRSELDKDVALTTNLINVTHNSTGIDQVRLKLLKAVSARLFSKLIQPAIEAVKGSERILIVPDGPLHLLPFSGLIVESQRSTDSARPIYLMELKPIHTVASSTLYSELKAASPAPSLKMATPSVVAFGNPSFPGDLGSTKTALDVGVRSAVERGLSFEALPAARDEVERITALFPENSLAYLGADASEGRAKSLPQAIRYVHFATHTVLDGRFPMNSAVVLSVPEHFEEGHENGLLQAWEIFEQVRFDADLVVLSACESGLGKEMGGEGLIGLTRAFQYAGARSVMASLWKISDRTTAEFMVHFYRHLKEGLPKDEALRAAQMEFIRGPIQVTNDKGERVEFDASAPYYWAAFQIYGDWQ